MENWKKVMLQGVICVGLLCVIWGGYILANKKIEQRMVLVDDDFSWIYQIDEAEIKNNEFVLRGFAFKLNQNTVEGNYEIVLNNIESGKNYFLKMGYYERPEVEAYFSCEYNYLHSGFVASIKQSKLDLQKNNYEVFLRVKDEDKAYQTGIYISNGQVMYVKPTEYKSLEVAGTDLEEVVDKGIPRVYRPDKGIFVYQYNEELYWIAEKNYNFEEDGNVYVQYQLETTQLERLPEIRLMNGWYWDNIGFYFTENECLDMDTGEYRVTRKSIPKEYAVKKIWTGNLIGEEWEWLEYFRPYYCFSE